MFLGIEIGGTKLQLGVGPGQGKPFVALERREIVAADGAEGIRKQILETAPQLIKQHDVQRTGIGFGGPVDPTTGNTIKSHQVTGWDAFPLVSWSQDELGRPTVIGNDCNVAALAEATYGAGQGARRVFYVTVGTGVGGGFVIDQKLYGDDRPAVAEIGHLRPGLHKDRPEATVEALASGWGIAATAHERILGRVSRHLPSQRGEATAFTAAEIRDLLDSANAAAEESAHELLRLCDFDLESLTAKLVGEATADGNELAEEILQQACEALGWAIAQVVTLLAPEKIVLGGGVTLIGETHYLKPLRAHIERFVFPPLAKSYECVAAQLGEDVVVHGAISIAESLVGK